MDNKKTIVIGASENPLRYSNMAIKALLRQNHSVVGIGAKSGVVETVSFNTEKVAFEDIDTITLYISQKYQPEYYDYFLSLQPKRIIFNPGTENPELYELAKANNIEPINACTLVMLSTGQY